MTEVTHLTLQMTEVPVIKKRKFYQVFSVIAFTDIEVFSFELGKNAQRCQRPPWPLLWVQRLHNFK